MGPIQNTPRVASAPPQGPTPARPAGTFRVASYNVENLFDAVDDPKRKDETTPPKDVEAMRRLAQALRQADADVVALQEVENIEILEHFLDEHLPGMYPHRVLVEGNDVRGIDVAVVSRHPILSVESHKDNEFKLPDGKKTTTFRRDLLRADLQVGAYPFSVYTSHFKAQGGGQKADDVRLAEARETRRIVQEEMAAWPGRRYVVAGDFNDTPDSAVGQVFLDEGQWHLEDALAGVPSEERITHPITHRSIDYLLFPDFMKSEFLGGGIQRLPREERGSDHLLIHADFRLTNFCGKGLTSAEEVVYNPLRPTLQGVG